MKKTTGILTAAVVASAMATSAWATPSVYPTGVTTYNPEKAWNGYTLFPAAGQQGAVLIDMNGNVVKFWKGLRGEPGPNKLLPGGFVLGSTGKEKGSQNYTDLVKVDFDGNIVWRFDHVAEIKDADGKYWSARQHHDYQTEGNPVGYYVPGEEYVEEGNTLILSHRNKTNKNVSTNATIMDDLIVEVDSEGEIVWEWSAADHFDQFGFSDAAKKSIDAFPGGLEYGDWAHMNSMSVVGPNKWWDAGDKRFNPENIIADGRDLNTIFIIEKTTGDIVWKIGPDFTASPELKKIGTIIGQHHAHIIPAALPGAGNVLVFDNGGAGGYDAPNVNSNPTGGDAFVRAHSRVLEIDPITLKVVWDFNASKLGFFKNELYNFFSPYISSAQRLPNGNTMITEGSTGRFLEVTPDYEVVWEYVSPYYVSAPGNKTDNKLWNMVYRAYRYPYDYVPQVKKPTEKAIVKINNSDFRVPGTYVHNYESANVELKVNGEVLDLQKHEVIEIDDDATGLMKNY